MRLNICDLSFDRTRLKTLVVVPPDEQHFLGASVVAAQLRRMGCEVISSFDEDRGTLAARVMHDAPQLILITCSRTENLEIVSTTVQTIRNAAQEGCIVALGGVIVSGNTELKELTGVDIVTSRAADAVAFCAQGPGVARQS